MRTAQNIAWLAGLIEGEGSFSFKNGSPKINLQMTDRDVVARAAAVMGVPVGAHARQPKGLTSYKPVWHCSAHGMRALGWMMTLYSMLGERRREKVRRVISQWKGSPRRLHASRGTRINAVCHPDRVTVSDGLCGKCYMRRWRAQKKAAA